MKKIGLVFSLVLFFSVSSQVNAQWEWQNSSPQSAFYCSIFFADSSYGWVTGWDTDIWRGIISRTTNGGTNWETDFYADFWLVSTIYFVDSLTGWAFGQNNFDTSAVYGNYVYKSTNGGRNWFRQPAVSDNLWGTKFIDANTGWAVGVDIIKTTDGGNIWEIQLINSVGLQSVDFINSNIGWAVGFQDVILKTTNGGSEWFYQRNKPGRRLTSVKFINENVGWAVGDSGRILKTIDGGTNWLLQRGSNDENDVLYSISLVNENYGWAVGYNNDDIGNHFVLKTTNGGSSWVEQLLPENAISSAVHFIDQNTGWVAGFNGAILKTTTGGVIPVELLNFSASVSSNDVILLWSTATETNNSGFEIERREMKNERSFIWKNIEFLNGTGTTIEPQSYSFFDKNLEAGKYQYRLKQVDFDGTFEYSNTVEVEIGLPTKFSLSQNYPNPFNPSTTIRWQAPVSGWQTLKVYDILGKEVATLVDEYRNAGSYNEQFTINNVQLSSGVYFYQLRVGDYLDTKKMILLK